MRRQRWMECGCGLHGRPKRRIERAIIQRVSSTLAGMWAARGCVLLPLRRAPPATPIVHVLIMNIFTLLVEVLGGILYVYD